jgi:hypothetical protein
VVSVADPYGRNFGFIDRKKYMNILIEAQNYFKKINQHTQQVKLLLKSIY